MSRIFHGYLINFMNGPVGLLSLALLLPIVMGGCNADDISSLPEAMGGGGATVPDCSPTAIIGESCGGGIVFATFFAGGSAILVSAPADESGPLQYKVTNTSSGVAGDPDDGRLNSGTFNSLHPASYICQNKSTAGYTDWYLPGFNELNALYPQRGLVGGFSTSIYWSSTETSPTEGAVEDFSSGSGFPMTKNVPAEVRCMRRP